MGREAAIIATGQTHHAKSLDHLSQYEMVYEAITRCLQDAEMKIDELDALLFTNMELFEGRAFPDHWMANGFGKPLPSYKIATGGTSGTSGVIAAFLTVASGQFDKVLLVGWEKHSEGHTQTGMSLTDPLWDRQMASGAVSNFALSISQFMHTRNITEKQAALVAVKARRNGANNPYAHLKEKDLTVEKVLSSPYLAKPVHLWDMCPQSDGACAILITSKEIAEKKAKRPAWIRAVATRHNRPYLGDLSDRLSHMRTLEEASKYVYKKLNITDPLNQFDVAEIYEPVSYAELAWYEALGFCGPGESGRLIEDGVTLMSGKLPVNPSGGVMSTNPVGASGVIRAAEASLQLHGKGGARQVEGARLALVTGYGVYSWSDVIVLSSSRSDEKWG